ncbi:MAG: hypothetical protein ACK5BJ_03440, partial [Bacteroidota bacterium]
IQRGKLAKTDLLLGIIENPFPPFLPTILSGLTVEPDQRASGLFNERACRYGKVREGSTSSRDFFGPDSSLVCWCRLVRNPFTPVFCMRGLACLPLRIVFVDVRVV